MPVKIFVGNLTEATESSSIRSLFEQYGEVVECDALGRFGFVHMKNEEDALSAIEGLNGTMVDGRKMNVELSTAKRGGRGGGRGGGFGGRGRGDYGGGRGGRGGDRGRSDRGGRGRGRGRFDPYSRGGYDEDEDYYGEESYPRRRPRLPPELLDRLEARLAAALMAPYADPYASREPYASRDPYAAAAGRDLLSRYRDPYAETRGADPYSRPPPEYYADRGERDTGADRSAATAVGYPDPASYGYGGRAGDAAKKRPGYGSSAGSSFGFGGGAGESSVASLTADATSSWSSWASGGDR